ncbi:MAG: NosD domain-containing protein, partial [Candidatus Undinarchaeales archaeon]
MNRKLTILAVVLVVLFVSVGGVNAYVDGGTYFNCSNCSDCEAAITNNTYDDIRLTADITNHSGTCIDNPTNFSNKTFDCQGHTIEGSISDYGIYLNSKTNNTIQNCVITNFSTGIYLKSNSNNNTIKNNTVSLNNETGIHLFSSSNTTVTNNTASSNVDYGIHLYSLSTNPNNNIITNNTANSNNYGIYLYSNSNNTINNNEINSNTYYGITLKSNSNNNTITNNTANSNFIGIQLLSSSNNNTLINNTANSNGNGIYLYSSSNNNTLINNTANSNGNGIYLKANSDNNTITNNTFNLNNIGIVLNSTSSNSISSNLLKWNSEDDVYELIGVNNVYTNNTLYLNKETAFLNLLTSKSENVSTEMQFNLSVQHPNGTSQTLNSINSITSSDGLSLSYNNSTTNIFGNITPTKLGIYSITLNITDSTDNEIYYSQNFYSVNNSRNFSTTVKYYMRPGVEPGHGQPVGTDSRSFLSSKPTKNGTFTCGTWVQASPDKAPVLTEGELKNISIVHWYKLDSGLSNYIGVERYVTYSYDIVVDINETISAFPTEFNLNVTNFTDIDWTMNDKSDWYNLSFKLRGSDPHWLSGPDNLSYVTIDYTTNAPSPMMTNPAGLTLISSTMDQSNLKEAEIILDGEGTKDLELKMPETADKYYVHFDNTLCNSTNCNYTQNGRYINVTANFGSEHTLEIGNCVDLSGKNEYMVNDSVTICPGTYLMNDTDNDGAIIANSDDITIDCNGATVIGNSSSWGRFFNVTNFNNVT